MSRGAIAADVWRDIEADYRAALAEFEHDPEFKRLYCYFEKLQLRAWNYLKAVYAAERKEGIT